MCGGAPLLFVGWIALGGDGMRGCAGWGRLRTREARGGMPVALKAPRRDVSRGVRGLVGGAGSCGGAGVVWW